MGPPLFVGILMSENDHVGSVGPSPKTVPVHRDLATKSVLTGQNTISEKHRRGIRMGHWDRVGNRGRSHAA